MVNEHNTTLSLQIALGISLSLLPMPTRCLAPRLWYDRFVAHLTTLGFSSSKYDPSLFVYKRDTGVTYLLLYVDDIALTASSTVFLQCIIRALCSEFKMTDLGVLHHFLGIAVSHNSSGLFLSQENYAVELLDSAGMSNCNVVTTSIDKSAKLPTNASPSAADPSAYRSMVGALQYLTFTRSALAFVVQQICLRMHDPHEAHLLLIKHVLRDVKSTARFGLQLHRSSPSKLLA
ncbi:uncharacterized mitochondrial protein AtMg00810-like [Phragmites australis]|uniref:uncharacterized mitochondrial protein AtMg00810-like n=1 Tax=Phragmites australis TaxID=29695 RepID=UPI002D776709|nr:uncharacterized mitochondrial protein AtMg00810-like [Phragmites australis]